MSSSRPGERPKRPLYLTATLLVLAVMGLHRATESAGTLDVLRHPDLAGQIVGRATDPRAAQAWDAWLSALIEAHRITLPVSIAGVILGALLAITATLTWLSDGRTRRWFLQAIGANAVFSVAAHLANRPVRADMLARLRGSLAGDAALGPAEVDQLLRVIGWSYPIALALQLALLVGGAVALSRPRARAFFAAASRPDAGGA